MKHPDPKRANDLSYLKGWYTVRCKGGHAEAKELAEKFHKQYGSKST